MTQQQFGEGHNSDNADDGIDSFGASTRQQLKAIIERIERLGEEKKAIQDDIKDVFAEAKGNGFDVKGIRQILKIRSNPDEYHRNEAIVDVYKIAMGLANDGQFTLKFSGNEQSNDDGESIA